MTEPLWVELCAAREALVMTQTEHDRAQRELINLTAVAERRAVEAAGDAGYGRNEADRQRYLTLALAADPEHRQAVQHEARWLRELRFTQAHLDGLLDHRRALELESRMLLVRAIAGQLTPIDSLALEADNVAGDWTADEAAESRLALELDLRDG